MRFTQPSRAPGKLSGNQSPHWFGLWGDMHSVGARGGKFAVAFYWVRIKGAGYPKVDALCDL